MAWDFDADGPLSVFGRMVGWHSPFAQRRLEKRSALPMGCGPEVGCGWGEPGGRDVLAEAGTTGLAIVGRAEPLELAQRPAEQTCRILRAQTGQNFSAG